MAAVRIGDVMTVAPAFLVFDLETIGDPSLPPPVLAIPDPSRTPAPIHNAICAAVAVIVNADYTPNQLRAYADEREFLRWFVKATTKFYGGGRICVVGWNSRGFDLPVIAARCFRLGIAYPRYYETGRGDMRYRFSTDTHIDLCDLTSDHGAGKTARLDAYAKGMGLPGKGDVGGGDVAAMMAAGRVDDVLRYCLEDTAQTALVFLRMQFIRGILSVDQYRVAFVGLLDAFDAQPKLAGLVAAVRARIASAEPGGPLDVEAP